MASLPDPQRCSRPWLASYPPGVPPTYRLPAVALPRLLDDAARDFPDHTALESGEHTLTFTQVREHVAALAAGLQTLPGDDQEAPLRGARVLVHTGDGCSGPIVLFALWRVGAVPVPVDPDLPAEVIAEVAREAGVVGAVGDARSLRRASLPPLRFTVEVLDDEWHGRRLPRALRTLPSRLDPRTWGRRGGGAVPAGDEGGTQPGQATAEQGAAAPDPQPLRTDVQELLDAGATARPAAHPSPLPDAPALVAVDVPAIAAAADVVRDEAASGEVTPVLDLVEHTHGTLVATAFQSRLWVPDIQAGRERVLVAEPTFDLVGSAMGLLSSVLSGATTILVAREERSLGKVIERTRPTLLVSRSPRVEALLLEDDGARRDLTSLRVCLVVGGRLHRHKAKELERRAAGARVRHLHGWKANVPISHGQPVYGRVDATRFGLPVTSTVAIIVDPDDPTSERGVDEPGRLLVHGPQVPGGGWVATDLVASADAEGWFTVIGHDAEVVDVGGKVRSPSTIADELLAHPMVRDAAVLDVDGALVAAVAPTRRQRPQPAALRDALTYHLDVRALPDDIVVLHDLPRSVRSGRDEAAVEEGLEELRDQIRAARGAANVHTVPAAADQPDDPDSSPEEPDTPPDHPRPSS